jgi:c-di-GMP-binding flagellar brake protein YcgR
MSERRKFPRLALRVQAEVSFPSWSTLKFFYSMNISKGGMMLELRDQVPIGASLGLTLRVLNEEPIRIEAVVRHVSPIGERFRVGVHFTTLDEAARKSIEDLIDAHLSKPT